MMVMSASVLGSQLANMSPVDNETDAINNFATAFETFFYNASVAGIPATAGTLASAKSAMISAMSGLSTQDNSATAIQTGIIAFWNTVVPAGATIWVTVPAIILVVAPTTLSTIASSLSTVFASNTSGQLSLVDSANAIATAIYSTQLGGIATLGPPPPAGTPTPIL